MKSVREKTKDQGQLGILNDLTGYSENFEAQKWTKTVDRGRLVHISNKVLDFFLQLNTLHYIEEFKDI